MRKLQFSNPKEVLAIVVRRKWWLIITAALLAMATGLVVLLLPSIYVSESLILIEPRDVPDDFVKNLINEDSDRRLDAIYQNLISRSNLLRIYNEFSDRLTGLQDANDEQRLERLRDSIGVEWVRVDRRSPISYFRIFFEDRDPRLARQINARLTDLFIKADSQTREEHVYGTVTFFQAEVSKVKSQLDVKEAELTRLKEKFLYELPKQQDSNHRTLDRLFEQLKASGESIDRLRTERNTLERQLAETPVTLQRERRSSRASPAPDSPLVEDYRAKKTELDRLKVQYTENHPDVRRLTAELAKLRAEIPPEDLLDGSEAETGSRVDIMPNPTYQKLSSRLSEVETEIKLADRGRDQIRRRIGVYRSRIDAAPRLEQELGQLQRVYDTLKGRFDDLSKDLFEAEKASSLEDKQKGEQFRVVDAASLPLSPAKPNRVMIMLIGLLGSLVVGLALAIGRDFAEQRFYNYREVEEFFGAPILVEIPQILSEEQATQVKRYRWATATAFVILAAAGLGVLLWIYTTPEVRNWGIEKISQIVSR